MDIVTLITCGVVVILVVCLGFYKKQQAPVEDEIAIVQDLSKPSLPLAVQHKVNVLTSLLQEAEAPAVTDEQITQIFAYFNEINAAKREIEYELQRTTDRYFNGELSDNLFTVQLDNYLSRINQLKYSLLKVG